MTSHVTVMPNGDPISTSNLFSAAAAASDISGATSIMQTSATTIVTLMALMCAYFII